MFNVNLEDEEDDSTMSRENSFQASDQASPSVVGQAGILNLTEDEPAMALASIAMVVTLEHIEVDGVSFASIFN